MLSNQLTKILAVSGGDTGEPNANPAGRTICFCAERIRPSHLPRDIQGVTIGCHDKHLYLFFRTKLGSAQDKRSAGTDIFGLGYSGAMRSQ